MAGMKATWQKLLARWRKETLHQKIFFKRTGRTDFLKQNVLRWKVKIAETPEVQTGHCIICKM